MFNYFLFAKRIKRPLLLDGANGSLLLKIGIKFDPAIWTSAANILSTEKVISVHKKYIKAGADIITTNTFRTNPIAVGNTNLSQIKLVRSGVELAIEAGRDSNVLIAGSNPPAEDCYQRQRTISLKELKYNHHKHISQLVEYGSDFILNETQSHFDEIKITAEYCSFNDIPYVISLFYDQNLKILSGENLSAVIKYLNDFNSLAIGFNCISKNIFRKTFPKITAKDSWGFYLNCGTGNFSDEKIICSVSPDDYLQTVKLLLDKNPSFIGACCGSTPDHILKLKNYFDEKLNHPNTGKN